MDYHYQNYDFKMINNIFTTQFRRITIHFLVIIVILFFIIYCIAIMSDIRNWTKEFLTEFINIYREEPCLWKIKDKSVYTNRNLKTIAYNRLADYSKTVYPEANRTWVVNRIQSLRGSFSKKFNKWYETKNKSGSSADNVHIP